LLRTNLTETDPAKLWNYCLQLVPVEEVFRTLKSDLAIRPIFHQDQSRIEAHVLVAFLAYCLYVTLGRQLKALAPGLTARSALEKFAAVQMVDVRIPTTEPPRTAAHALHPTRAGTRAPAGALAADSAGTTAAQNKRRPDRLRQPLVVQTFEGARKGINHLASPTLRIRKVRLGRAAEVGLADDSESRVLIRMVLSPK
jgi:hypothetical protein